jgi:DNA-binding NarL/FixJ family response regulator
MARCLLLELADVEALEGPAHAARAEGDDPVASALMVQLVSAFVASGRIAEATDRAADLLAYATEVGHRARQVDAEVALLALRGRRERVDAPEGLAAEAERLMNNHALWKLLVCLYRQHLLRGELGAAEGFHGLLEKHYDWLNPGYRNSFVGLDAYRQALFDERSAIDLSTPGSPTLLSVDNVLASAEAVAIGGSFATAAEWIAWLEVELPPEVVTSLEWPACRARVEGLLLLRVGQRLEAIERLQASIGRCEERGDAIEAEICRAQLAAVTDDREAAAFAAERLNVAGIDASPFAAAARRVAARAAIAGDPLTVLQARVIARVARGLSYRETEADLGLPSRGVSKVLTACYAKLGVSGRIAAVQVARDRLIA